MKRLVVPIFAVLLFAFNAHADGLLFTYEGDILPGDPGSGFSVFDSCAGGCSRRLENGHFLLEWGIPANFANYNHLIAEPPNLPPESLWVEWQFRSNQAIPPGSTSCDGSLTVDYKGILDIAFMFQDAVVDFEGGDFVLGLDPDIFHTYRFESLDGANYTMAVDGFIFNTDFDPDGNDFHLIQLSGRGGCIAGPTRPVPVRNEWDFVRYGTIGTGEQVVSTDPPEGDLTAAQANQFDSFLITFDEPAYLYNDDITVTSTGGTAPTIAATRRVDNGPPNVLEVFINGPLPPGQTTTFSFDTGTGPQQISYTRLVPEIPATSTWGLLGMGAIALIAGSVVFHRRLLDPR